MRRHSLVFVAGVMTILAVGGCTTSEENTASNEASPSPSPDATQSPATAKPFDQPLVSQKDGDKTKAGSKDDKTGKKIAKNRIPGLLQSTDPDERAKRVQAGIRGRAGLDPFASLPPILTFKTPVSADTLRAGNPGGGFGPGGAQPGGQTGSGGSTIAQVPSIPTFPEASEIRPPRPTIARRPGGTSVSGMNPGGSGENPGLKPLPPIPEPTLARAVEVSGVVTLGGQTQAIVKAPNEPTSRHVSVGQRLSNGQVLVKRIEVNSGSDPIVIFEENGVEVARAVGEKSSPAGAGGVPTASLPQATL